MSSNDLLDQLANLDKLGSSIYRTGNEDNSNNNRHFNNNNNNNNKHNDDDFHHHHHRRDYWLGYEASLAVIGLVIGLIVLCSIVLFVAYCFPWWRIYKLIGNGPLNCANYACCNFIWCFYTCPCFERRAKQLVAQSECDRAAGGADGFGGLVGLSDGGLRSGLRGVRGGEGRCREDNDSVFQYQPQDLDMSNLKEINNCANGGGAFYDDEDDNDDSYGPPPPLRRNSGCSSQRWGGTSNSNSNKNDNKSNSDNEDGDHHNRSLQHHQLRSLSRGSFNQQQQSEQQEYEIV